MDNLTIGHGTTINDMVEKGKIYGMEYSFPSKGKKYDDNKPMLAQFYKHFLFHDRRINTHLHHRLSAHNTLNTS